MKQALTEGVDQRSVGARQAIASMEANINKAGTERNMSEFETMILDQEPDTMAFIPSHPDYIIVGTYSLLSQTDESVGSTPTDNEGIRRGSLQILPVQSAAKQHSSEWPLITLARLDLPFGIYDIRFHPKDQTLLGVATSKAEILFYRILPQQSSSGILTAIELAEAGKILVEEQHPDDGRLAIITQFQFIEPDELNTENKERDETVLLSATTQFGNTKLIKVLIPRVGNSKLEMLECQNIDIHKQSFDLEAWTVLPIFTNPSTLWLLSGGDDSQLIVSNITLSSGESFSDPDLDLDLLTPTPQHVDKRNHEAGVVYICTLGTVPPNPTTSTYRPPRNDHPDRIILTGSYDENLKLFLFAPPRPDQPKTGLFLASEINLGGGVWRIIPLDTYETHNGRDYILLVAAHTAGACIVRLSCARAEHGSWCYMFTVEKWFMEGHQSLVYSVCAKRVPDMIGAWDIVSASFYDKVICEWRWIDGQALGG